MVKIPNYFHFVFGLKPQTEPFHLAHYLCLASCMAVNRPEKIYFHYDHLPYGPWWDLIASHLTLNKVNPENFFSTYEYKDPQLAKYRYAHVSDIIRLEVLDQFGGIYADMDTLFINPVPAHFFEKTYIMGKELVDYNQQAAQVSDGSLCNAWIGSAPGAAFGQIWLDNIRREYDGTWSAHSTFLPYKLSKQYPELIHIEPERSFYDFDWTVKGIRDIFENKREVSSHHYSIHLWSHLWWSRERVDRTTFHAGYLTPNYVRYGSTSFSVLARRFLPRDLKTSYVQFLWERSSFLTNKVATALKRKMQHLLAK